MAAEPTHGAGAGGGAGEPNHARRFMTIWIVASLIATPLVVLLIGPIMPPGNGSAQASGHVVDNTVLIGMATPVLLLVLTYLIYAIVNFRAPKGGEAILEGPAVSGNSRVQSSWIVITTILVLSLAVYGTVRLTEDGAGSGQGRLAGMARRRQEAAGAGHRPGVGLHLPLPHVWGSGDESSRASRGPDGRTPCHLARCDPLVLGVPVGGQGRRESQRGQRRVRQADQDADLRSSLRRAVRDLARLHVRPRARGKAGRVQAWSREQQKRFAATTKYLPPYSTKYVPEPARRAE